MYRVFADFWESRGRILAHGHDTTGNQTVCSTDLFFNISTSPAFVKSLPSTAFFKSGRSSEGKGFLGGFPVFAIGEEAMTEALRMSIVELIFDGLWDCCVN